MNHKKALLAVFFLLVVGACKQADANAEAVRDLPISTFTAPFPKNNKKLSHLLGDLITIKDGKDTLAFKIISSKEDNLIIDTTTGDTLFQGTVCKYRDLYYLNEKINDTSYYISALKIKGNLLYGLSDRWSQLYAVDDKISKGHNKTLVKFMNLDARIIRLQPDKKELKLLFTSIMNEVVPDTLINYTESTTAVPMETETKTPLEADANDHAIKVYPNPATDFITVALNSKSKSSFQLVDLNGKTVLQGPLTELNNTIDVANQKKGIYVLKISNAEKNEIKTVKIAINK